MQEPKEGYRNAVPVLGRVRRGRKWSQNEASRERPRLGLKSPELGEAVVPFKLGQQ